MAEQQNIIKYARSIPNSLIVPQYLREYLYRKYCVLFCVRDQKFVIEENIMERQDSW